MPHCIDSNTIITTHNRNFNGINWEKSIEDDKIIKNLSLSN